MALRKCRDCGTEAHSEEDLKRFKIDKTSKYGRENLCNSCSYKRYGKSSAYREYRREYMKKWRDKNPGYYKPYMKKWREDNPDYFKKIYGFDGKLIMPDENPRTNVCHECGRSYPDELKRQTSLHHIIYNPDNPLDWTVELCSSCHAKLHQLLKKDSP